ncbi:MAG: relaxase/mobilization nuclease domain-containing protein [Candidatus Humimicrobiaceae bacterium]
MAVIKRIASKGSIKNIINYVLNKEKTDERIISGKDCLPESSVESMNAIKESYNKTDGISYHHIIQSFKPGEITPEKAHKIGIEFAEKQFKGYEVLIATHIDKAHIHNHLVINSVSFVDGRKLISNKETLREIKRDNDRICKERGLSVIEKPYAPNVYSMAEYKMAEKGMSIWKEQLRAAIDEAKKHSTNIWEMGDYLEKNFNIDMKIQNKNLSFLHPDKQKYCRGSKLGLDYTIGETDKYFKREGRREFDYTKGKDTKYFERGSDDKEVNPGRLETNKTNIGLSKVGFGIESIAKKIARDIEKEHLRAGQKKVIKAREKAEERERYKDKGRDRDRGRDR